MPLFRLLSLLIAIPGFFLNAFILYRVVKQKKLIAVPNFFYFQSWIFDILTSMFVIWTHFFDLEDPDFYRRPIICQIDGFLVTFLHTGQSLTIVSLSVYHFYKLYLRKPDLTITQWLILDATILSYLFLICAIPLFPGVASFKPMPGDFYCFADTNPIHAQDYILPMLSVLQIAILIPSVCMLYMMIWKQIQKYGKHNKLQQQLEELLVKRTFVLILTSAITWYPFAVNVCYAIWVGGNATLDGVAGLLIHLNSVTNAIVCLYSEPRFRHAVLGQELPKSNPSLNDPTVMLKSSTKQSEITQAFTALRTDCASIPCLESTTNLYESCQNDLTLFQYATSPPGDSVQPNDRLLSKMSSAPRLQDLGGRILVSPKVIPVFYASVPRQSDLIDFYKATVESDYLGWLKEYDSQVPGRVFGQGTVGQPIILPDAASNVLTLEGDIRPMLQGLVTKGIITPDRNTYYPIHFAPGVTVQYTDPGTKKIMSTCKDVCGFHTAVNTPKGAAIFAVMPDHSGACSKICGGNVDPFKNLCSTTSHELVESITNPGGDATPYAIIDPNSGMEIADICNQMMATITVNGRTWSVQRFWSNARNGCVIM
ncbi:hypothetical protein EDD86DRAFT_250406 [Gorgonomyces haynaldii]|nr:hypothetical protein EDD86DRAFT_250406 [Gorgonomyces haynaldii]